MRYWLLVVALVAVLAAGVLISAEPAQAADRCGGSVVTPTTWRGKAAISVYTGSNVRPENVSITYNGRRVPAPSDWGIRTDAPQDSTGGKWVYFIADRWLYNVLFPDRLAGWAQGWRWRFIYDC